jgi:predicted nucleotidyltransferase
MIRPHMDTDRRLMRSWPAEDSMAGINERMTDRALVVMSVAERDARLRGATAVEPQHLLLAIALETSGIAANFLSSLGVSAESISRLMPAATIEIAGADPLTRSSAVEGIVARSFVEAIALNHFNVGTEHLLLAMTNVSNTLTRDLFEQLGLDRAVIRRRLYDLLGKDVVTTEPTGGSDPLQVNPITAPVSHLILSPGTQVVALVEVKGTDGKPIHPSGAVGIITQSPADYWHSYRVRFPGGAEASLRRDELAILSQYKTGGVIGAASGGSTIADPLAEYDLYRFVIYRCIVGSRAYGLDDSESDTDRRGVYLPPARLHWSLYGVPEQLENQATEEVYWEAQKFVTMALKANPNVLECLYTPLIEQRTSLAEELLDLRPRLLSKMVYQTYNGYVISQFKKLQADLRNKGQVKWKHVMHLLRLLLAGIAVLRDGVVPVHVGEHRDQLLKIKRGELPFEECEAWRMRLHEQFDAAFQSTMLPDRPDYHVANEWLLKARRMMV